MVIQFHGACQVALGRQQGLIGMVAAGMDASPLGGFHHHLEAVRGGVMTSTPALTSPLVASASLTGIDQSPVKMTCVVMVGSTDRAPSVKALMLRSTCGIGLAATKPSFFDLVAWPAAMPLRYWPSSI